jgi:8-oxo-dGTP pyrophosphatase MutT (NUDIX family)
MQSIRKMNGRMNWPALVWPLLKHEQTYRAKGLPIVSRCSNATREILMFRHLLAGIQLVKGTVEPSENPADAARRELF